MGMFEFWDCWCDEVLVYVDWGGYEQCVLWGLCYGVDFGFCFFDCFYDFGCVVIKDVVLFGWVECLCCVLKQVYIQVVFQLGNLG